ncbi:MAG TPA: ABC transporter permease subunit [Pirellulales bacterium]|nr:ABC transporter permease subunit [Pirellulales bacterium]
MSQKLLDSPPATSGVAARPAPAAGRTSAGSSAAAALAPCVAALVALAVHRFLPDSPAQPSSWIDDVSPWLRPYPLILQGLLAGSLLIAGLQSVWPSLRSAVEHYGPLTAGAVAVTAVWDVTTLKMAWFPMPYFPGPDLVLGSMISDRGILLDSTYRSLRLLLSGYVLGVTAGLVSGMLMGWFRRVRYWGMPVLKVLGPIPATAFVPLAMVLFSNSFLAGAALIGLAVWFPVTMLTTSGIANVPASYFDVARTLGAGRAYLIFRVALPAALPSVFIGLFMGLGASFLTLIVAETVGVRSGLGWYLKWQQGYAEYANVYAALVIMAVFFSSLMTLLFKLRDWVLGWQKGLIRW